MPARTNVFEGRFRIPKVQKDYEVLRVVVSGVSGRHAQFRKPPEHLQASPVNTTHFWMILAYMLALAAVGVKSRRKVESQEDFAVAGRGTGRICSFRHPAGHLGGDGQHLRQCREKHTESAWRLLFFRLHRYAAWRSCI